jgi:energy-coupling factor transporter ATP-binding protein EcfA2
MLEVNNIEIVYSDVIRVLKGISFEVPDKQIVAFLGSNGAGKSTVFNCINGIGTIAGTVFGALFITALPEAIRFLRDWLGNDFPFLVSRMADLQSSIYGLVIIVFLIFEPSGLFGIWLRLKKYWLAWPYSYNK